MFGCVLVANRGEIAVRVIRTLRRLGVRAIAVYSDADADAPHVRLADEAVRLGPTPAVSSYLDIERVLAAAALTGAQAIHPGYGFLSENAAFARACEAGGVVFVGPPASAIEAMGDKIAAKRTVEAAGVPVVPGVHEPGMDDEALRAAAPDVGYPLLVKAAAGGGGKGMRVVRDPAALDDALAAARREALGAFGDDALLLERYLERPRHIEVQVLADQHGATLHLGERECSLQRRHQKVIEEAPSPLLDAAARARMGAAAVDAARACGYVGAGTVELIVAAGAAGSAGPEFFFLEMNTRLQVEHPVTELVTGLDLVELQLRVAAGEPLPFGQSDVVLRGHAVEARIYAEDPARGFLPTGGTVLRYREPAAARVDSGIAQGSVVGSAYDPMLAKVIAHGPDRATALQRLDAALGELVVLGVGTNVGFLRRLLADADVVAGRLDTGLIERRGDVLVGDDVPPDVLAAAALARALDLEPRTDADGWVDPFSVPSGWRPGDAAPAQWRLTAGDVATTVAVRGRVRPAVERGTGAGADVVVGRLSAMRSWAHRDGEDLVVGVDGRVARYAYAEDGDVAWLGRDGRAWAIREEERLVASRRRDASAAAAGPLVAPMPGTVIVVAVESGDSVTAGQALLVVEAMKMEHPVVAPSDGVAAVHVRVGEVVALGQPLATVEPAPSSSAAAAGEGA